MSVFKIEDDRAFSYTCYIGQISVPVAEDTTSFISTPAIAAISMICSQIGVTNMGEKCLDPLFEDVSRGNSNSIFS